MRRDKISDPFEQISPELWLMLASAGGDIIKTQNLLQQPINWDWLLQLAVHHRVYPLVYKTLSQLNYPTIPQHVLDLLQQKCWQNAILAINMTQETIRVAKCFESNSILAIVLKGAPLAWRLYGDITIRPSSDIDILVPFEELEKAISVLETEGYTRNTNMTSRQLQIYLRMAKKNNHHLAYRHSNTNIYLELHWKLGHGSHLLSIPIKSSIKIIEVDGSPLLVLSDEEWLLYLMLHGASHGWFRMRWLVDITEFIQQRSLNWDKLLHLATASGMVSILHQSLILANRLLAIPVPLDLLSTVNNDRFAWQFAYTAIDLCLAEQASENMGNNAQQIIYFRKVYNSQLHPKSNNKFSNVLKLFNPTIYEIKLISLPNKLYALYYFIRPCYLVCRRLRKLLKAAQFAIHKKNRPNI